MRKTLPFLLLVLFAAVIEAGNSTVSFTAAQSTQIQTRLIPLFNRSHCAQYGQVPTCTSANLVTGGCVPIVAKTITVDSCVVFTQDAAGEQAFLQEQLNTRLVGLLGELARGDAGTFCTNFKASTVGTQNTICTSLGLAAGCVPCS